MMRRIVLCLLCVALVAADPLGAPCTACPAYSYYNGLGCVPCGIGTYMTSDTSCAPCAAGTFNSVPGATACTVCASVAVQ